MVLASLSWCRRSGHSQCPFHHGFTAARMSSAPPYAQLGATRRHFTGSPHLERGESCADDTGTLIAVLCGYTSSPGGRRCAVMSDEPNGKPGLLLPYRSAALEANESSARLDELLPVTSLRIWLLAVAAAVLIAAAVAYTAITPRNVTVDGSGRVVGDGGIGLVTSTANGQFGSFTLEPGSHVTVGQHIADVVANTGTVPQYSQVDGTLLGYLPSPGAPVTTGAWLAQVTLKVDDGKVGLIMVSPEEAGKVQTGQPVTVSIVGGPVLAATIGPNRTPALSAPRVQEGLGTLDPPLGPRVVVEVLFTEPAPVGDEFTAVILVSERTLLGQLLGTQ